jgi:hypothetical protein
MDFKALVARFNALISAGEAIKARAKLIPGAWVPRYIPASNGDTERKTPDRWNVDGPAVLQWKSSCASLLHAAVPAEHPHAAYAAQFRNSRPDYDTLVTGLAILRSVKDELKSGFLPPPVQAAAARSSAKPLRAAISYSTVNLDFARCAQRALANVGVEAFMADSSLKPGQGLTDVAQPIRVAKLVFVLWSQHAVASKWVQQEVGVALGGGAYVVPVVLEKDSRPHGFLDGKKYIDASKDQAAALLEIQDTAIWLRGRLAKRRTVAIAKSNAGGQAVAEAPKRQAKGMSPGWVLAGAAALAWLANQGDGEEENE